MGRTSCPRNLLAVVHPACGCGCCGNLRQWPQREKCQRLVPVCDGKSDLTTFNTEKSVYLLQRPKRTVRSETIAPILCLSRVHQVIVSWKDSTDVYRSYGNGMSSSTRQRYRASVYMHPANAALMMQSLRCCGSLRKARITREMEQLPQQQRWESAELRRSGKW